jgi:hypothetical protein
MRACGTDSTRACLEALHACRRQIRAHEHWVRRGGHENGAAGSLLHDRLPGQHQTDRSGRKNQCLLLDPPAPVPLRLPWRPRRAARRRAAAPVGSRTVTTTTAAADPVPAVARCSDRARSPRWPPERLPRFPGADTCGVPRTGPRAATRRASAQGSRASSLLATFVEPIQWCGETSVGGSDRCGAELRAQGARSSMRHTPSAARV